MAISRVNSLRRGLSAGGAVFVSLLLMAACSAGEKSAEDRGTADEPVAQSAESQADSAWTVAYDCEDGSYVVAQFRQATDDVWLFLPSKTVLLPHVPAASGARYSDGTYTIWSKGREARVGREDGGSVSCVENRRRSIIEDAKLRGVDYWGTGNEPGWTLEIGPESTVLITNYGQERHELVTPAPLEDRENRRTTYRGTAGGQEIVITIVGRACNDDMSGESFETTVEVELDGRKLRGCGLPLH